ncbi:MAG: UvrD-helicase domain-containing protein [Patescibacteria group bacterium]|jgi:DNA helicase-2/ATP-dependent DNA helicase PcrA
MMIEWLKKLNPTQYQAATHEAGPLLIVAGAGTGKTTVLISRLAYLILEKKVSTDAILLLTFTEKAAGELEERADRILPYGYVDLWINTFHGLGERILREQALDIGLSASFRLLSDTEQWVLIKKNLNRFALDYYKPLGNPTKFISELLRHFSRLKDENISPADYEQYVEELESDQDGRLSGQKIVGRSEKKRGVAKKTLPPASAALLTGDESDGSMEIGRLKELANAYHIYNQLLLENNYLDFGDLIVYTLKLFKERPNILRYYQEKFRYIMVDEFQDTNYAQYELVRLLAAHRSNLVVVGDDDQAIYKFRGASLSNIMQFKDDYPQAAELVLTENYRSRQEILDYAYRFIQNNNPNRLEIKLKTDKRLTAKGIFAKSSVPAVKFYNFSSVGEEVSFVIQKIREIYDQETARSGLASWSDFAVLVRANDTADAYVKELTRCDIPNQFMSWRGLYYKPIILDCLAYLRLLDNYHESSALFRVLNMEIFKVAHLDLVNINKMAARKVWSLYEALKNVSAISGVSAESLKNIRKLLSLIDQHSLLVADNKPTKIFLRFAYDSGLLEGLNRDRDLEIYSYLNQFYQKMKKMEETEPDLRLSDFMAALELELEAGETGALKLDFADSETVKVMTVHGAKGLEFKYVFIVNLVDKKFPTIARGEKIAIPDALIKEKSVPGLDSHIEEERRLFYVAATRAKEELYLTAAKDYGGVREKKPSRFIIEMGLDDSGTPDIALSEKNEFLRDLHYLTRREAVAGEDAVRASYPLPDKFSFSQLAAFSTCPLQYKFAFILKIPASTDKASLIFGRVLHNTLYNFLLPTLSERQKIQGDLFASSGSGTKAGQRDVGVALSEKRLLELYQEFWQADGYQNKQEREDYRQKGREALKKFWTVYQSAPPVETLFLEKKFSFRIGDDIIKGTIDRVDKLADGTLEVVDYKTGKAKSKLDFAAKRQLILYQLFLEEFLKIKVSALSYYYLESGEKFTFVASEKEIDHLKLEVQAEIAAIKKRQFPPRPSMMCDFCDFNTICEFRQV